MAISITLNEYLSLNHINDDILKRRVSHPSSALSFSIHLPTELVAKTVILQNLKGQYLMATLPIGSQLCIFEINNRLNEEFHLVNEWLLDDFLPDYRQGAIPCPGTAHKMRMLIDNILLKAEQIYIASDDSRYLVKITSQQYKQMEALMPSTNICGSAIGMPQFVTKLSNNNCLD